MRFFFLLLGLFTSQVYASVLPLASSVLRRQFTPPECASQCAPLMGLAQSCTNHQDFSCICKPDLSAQIITCSECALASPVLTPELRQDLKTGSDAYIATVVHVCKTIFGIDIPGGNVTIPDVPAPTEPTPAELTPTDPTPTDPAPTDAASTPAAY